MTISTLVEASEASTDSTPSATVSSPAEETRTADDNLARARLFWWWVLGSSAAVSVVGNGLTHFLRVKEARPELLNPMENVYITPLPALGAALLAILVPVALLVHTHGLALLVQAPTRHGNAARAVVVAAVLGLMIGGFYLSFDAFCDLALRAGFKPDQIWVLPVLVDGSIAAATAVLLLLPPTAEALGAPASLDIAPPVSVEPRTAMPQESDIVIVVPEAGGPLTDSTEQAPPAEEAAPAVADLVATALDQSSAETDDDRLMAPDFAALPVLGDPEIVGDPQAAQPEHDTVAPAVPVWTKTIAEDPTEELVMPSTEWLNIAKQLCHGDPARVADVSAILHLAFDERRDPAQIAAVVHWSPSAVTRLLDDAEPYLLLSLAS